MHHLIDTGPIVALLNKTDEHHQWVCAQIRTIKAPIFTCEAVLSEAFHLLEPTPRGIPDLLALLKRGFICRRFNAQKELPALERLLTRFADLPMSFADACLVRMAEMDGRAMIFTLDSDFYIYRKNGRQMIPVLTPAPR